MNMPKFSFDQILRFVLSLNIWDIAKSFVLFGILLYLIFAFVVVRQVNLMLDSLEVELEGLIKFIAWLHLFLVIGVLVFGFIYL